MTHDFIIYAMRQRARADNLTICYRQNQINVSFSRVCPVIDNDPLSYRLVDPSYFDSVMTKFIINNRTDAWKADVNLLKLNIREIMK